MNYSEAGEFPDEAEEQDHDEDDADLKKRPGTIDSTVIEGEPVDDLAIQKPLRNLAQAPLGNQ
jgi:hypothetical protein